MILARAVIAVYGKGKVVDDNLAVDKTFIIRYQSRYSGAKYNIVKILAEVSLSLRSSFILGKFERHRDPVSSHWNVICDGTHLVRSTVAERIKMRLNPREFDDLTSELASEIGALN